MLSDAKHQECVRSFRMVRAVLFLAARRRVLPSGTSYYMALLIFLENVPVLLGRHRHRSVITIVRLCVGQGWPRTLFNCSRTFVRKHCSQVLARNRTRCERAGRAHLGRSENGGGAFGLELQCGHGPSPKQEVRGHVYNDNPKHRSVNLLPGAWTWISRFIWWGRHGRRPRFGRRPVFARGCANFIGMVCVRRAPQCDDLA